MLSTWLFCLLVGGGLVALSLGLLGMFLWVQRLEQALDSLEEELAKLRQAETTGQPAQRFRTMWDK